MPGGGKLVIETANTGPDESLTIRGTGHGMDARILAHVFEPFFTTKGVGKGTGLGLATVYGIVQQSAGTISVQSEVGSGTTFTVSLPAIDEAPAFESASEPLPSGSGTVLLVEDEAGVRRLIANILEQHGYRVMAAAGGEEALRMVKESPFPIDLLISDVVMPKMRGPELAAQLRSHQPELKVLFISGYPDHPSVTSQMVSGRSHFLPKPFVVDSLMRAVSEVLGSP
jgi:two-component system cell cycle sensor histidine kinase/response regulator CckA